MWDVLQQGGVVIYPLGLCSLLTLAIFLERLVRFSRADRDPAVVARRAEAALKAANSPPQWPDEPAPSIRAVAAAFAGRGLSSERVEERVRAALSSEALRLSAHVSIVGTIGNIAPFIGLFGTVLGSSAPSATSGRSERPGQRSSPPASQRRWWPQRPDCSWPSRR